MKTAARIAVIGAGSLGKEHVRILAQLSESGRAVLSGVFDNNRETCLRVAEKHKIRAFESIEQAADASDALTVVTPTQTHFEIARDLLIRGKHLLVEKPLTNTAAHAAELVRLAKNQNLVLQVGHVERFNPVYTYLAGIAAQPRFIEAHRLSPFPARSTDIGVVLDLMIHDIDVVQGFVKSPVVQIDAVGISVLSSTEDIANARLKFANGCIANLTASRVSPERMRKIRVFSEGEFTSYVSLDFRAQEGFIYRIAKDSEAESSLLKKLFHSKDSTVISEFAGKRIVREPVPINKDEPLKLELEHFAECVNAQQTPLVSGEVARKALEVAFEITRQIHERPGSPAL